MLVLARVFVSVVLLLLVGGLAWLELALWSLPPIPVQLWAVPAFTLPAWSLPLIGWAAALLANALLLPFRLAAGSAQARKYPTGAVAYAGIVALSGLGAFTGQISYTAAAAVAAMGGALAASVLMLLDLLGKGETVELQSSWGGLGGGLGGWRLSPVATLCVLSLALAAAVAASMQPPSASRERTHPAGGASAHGSPPEEGTSPPENKTPVPGAPDAAGPTAEHPH